MRDLCDECPGRLGEVVTREGRRGGGAALSGTSAEMRRRRGGRFGVNCQFVRLWSSVRFRAAFSFNAFFNSVADF